jgi:hypothetical protein
MSRFLTPGEREAMSRLEPPFTNVSLQRPAWRAGWRAARDYYEQHSGLAQAEKRERALREALEAIAVYDGADWDVEGVCGLAVDALVASPQSGHGPGGASGIEVCGRIMVGSGTDTYDPCCELPEGHDGMCKSSSATDQHKLS